MRHLSTTELEAGLDHIRRSPADGGTVELIVRRPGVDEREVLADAGLDTAVGLIGDTWEVRPSMSTDDGSPHPEKQVTLMNARTIELLAGSVDRWPLAGDQLYVDLDLSHDNLPAGTRLALGSAVIEVTAPPHTGCAKFAGRFGADALRFVNSQTGRQLRLRGMNAKVVRAGALRRGDTVTKL